jgi:hypothetical protein
LREEIVSSVSDDTGQGCSCSLCTAKGIGAYKVHATVSHGTLFTREWQKAYMRLRNVTLQQNINRYRKAEAMDDDIKELEMLLG